MAPAAALIALGLGLCLAAPLGGCVSAAIGAGATAGVTIAQERSVEEAIGDAAIKVALTHKLIQADFRDLFRAVGVDVIEGRVMLSGIVDNQRLKDQASELTWQVGDVDAVINEIQLADPARPADYLRDTWITARLRARLLTDKVVFDINYNITTYDGVIYLIGIARGQREHDRVVAHARDVPNARRLIDHIILADDPRRPK